MAQRGNVGNLLVSLRVEMGQLRLDLQNVQKEFNTSFSNLQRSAVTFGKGIVGGLLAGFSVSAIASFAKGIVDLGGRLQDLSEQTGISTRLLSGMKSTLEENGSSLDAFATGIFRAQKELGEIKKTTDPAALAIQKLGLNFEELIAAEPDEFVRMITEALAKLPPGFDRAAIASQIFSRAGRELVPALIAMAGNFDDLYKRGLSPEQIARVDELGDAWTRFANVVRFEALDAFAGLIKDLQEANRLIQLNLGLLRREGGTGGALGAVGDLLKGAEVPKPKPAAGARPPLQGGVPDRTAQNALESFTAGLQKQADAIRVNIRELELGGDAARAFGLDLEFAAFKQKLAADPKTAGIVGQVTAAYAVLREQILQLGREFEQAKFAAARLDEAAKGASQDSAEWLTYAEDVAKITDAAKEAEKALDELRTRKIVEMFDQDSAEFLEQVPENLTRMRAAFATTGREIENMSEVFGLSFDSVAANISNVRAHIEDLLRAGISPASDEIRELAGELERLGQQQVKADIFSSLADSLERGISDTVRGIAEGSQTLSEGMQNLARNMALAFQEELLRLSVLNPIRNWLMSMLEIEGERMPVLDIAKLLGFGELPAAATGAAGAAAGAVTAAPEVAAITTAATALTTSAVGLDTSALGLSTSALGLDTSALGLDTAAFGLDTAALGLDTAGIGLSSAAVALDAAAAALAGSGGSEALGGLGGLLGGLFSSAVPKERGGLVMPQFAAGGAVPIIAHGGEYVISKRSVDRLGQSNLDFANRTGKWPKSGASKTDVIINGDITPRRPEMTPEQVIQVVTRDFDNRGPAMNMFEQRTLIRGGA